MTTIRGLSAADTSREIPVYATGNALDVNVKSAFYAENSGSGANDNDILFTTDDISAYNRHVFQVTAGAATIEVSVDGEAFGEEGAAPVLVVDMQTEATAGVRDLVGSMAAGKVYTLDMKMKKLRIRQDGPTATMVKMASYVG